MTALADSVSDQRLLIDLQPVVERELNRHLSTAKEWFPHEYVPWSEGEDFSGPLDGREWTPDELRFSDAARTSLIINLLTEDNLPSYHREIERAFGRDSAWGAWVNRWTAEEGRHAFCIRDYLLVTRGVDPDELERARMDTMETGYDSGDKPLLNVCAYVSFQELATNISHRRTATLAKQYGNGQLSKICGVIAADELRHAKAYKSFVSSIFEIDPSEMMLAFADMMRKRIIMPAQFLRQQGEKVGAAFTHFSDAAQRLNVYTSTDYTDITESLVKDWNIASITGLTDPAEKARDYLMGLPARFRKISDRGGFKAPLAYEFNWITR